MYATSIESKRERLDELTEEFLLLSSTTNDDDMRSERREDETEATKMFHYACELSESRMYEKFVHHLCACIWI